MKMIDRRRFLQMGLATGAGVVAATSLPGGLLAAGPRTGGAQLNVLPAPLDKRRVVVIDCAGGNDGLSMLPPITGTARSIYNTLRPRTSIPVSQLLPVTASVGMHPSLARINGLSPAIIQGIGVHAPDLSHFEMMRRWWTGDQDSLHSSPTGFLGRICDVIGDTTAPVVGLSLGYGPSP
ncbi:MAG: hypothetical protein ABIZ34_02935, partial [Candidatus Limnocylindrales bacterium]